MRGGSKPRIRPLVEAAVRSVGSAGIHAEGVLVLTPQSTISGVRHQLTNLVADGVVYSAGYAPKLYFADKADADAHTRACKERRAASRRALQRKYWKQNYVPKDAPSWSPEALKILDEMYPTHSARIVAEACGKPESSVWKMAQVRKIVKVAVPRAPRPKRERKPKIESRPCLPPSKPAKAAARGPGYLEGEVVDALTLPRSPGFKYTVYERKPDPHRTNTFSQFG